MPTVTRGCSKEELEYMELLSSVSLEAACVAQCAVIGGIGRPVLVGGIKTSVRKELIAAGLLHYKRYGKGKGEWLWLMT